MRILRIKNMKFQGIVFSSSLPEMFCKQGVLRNFVKFTGKHLCQRLYFTKVAGLRPATFTAQKMKFSIKDFVSKGDQIRRKLQLGHIY